MQPGKLVAAVQEERFSRVKNDRSLPTQAFEYCLDAGRLTIDDVDCIAFYEDTTAKLGRQLWMGMTPGISEERRAAILRRALSERPEQEIRRRWGYDGPFEFVDHHLSHAASSFLFSGFDESAILTVDGVGDWATTTYGAGSGTTIERFEQVDYPHSLGLFYAAITGYLGFEVNEGEYKVMGLAPYGEPRLVDQVRQLLEPGEGGQFRLNLPYFAFQTRDRMFSDGLADLLGGPPRRAESAITQFHMDVARSAQVVLEDVLLEKVRYLHSRFPSDNLCMAGGVALNVVANRRCLEEGPFTHLFVQPAAGDAGGCLGAAAMVQARHLGTRPSHRLGHAYYGPAISVADTLEMLETSGATFTDYRGNESGLITRTVDELIQGKVIGWVHGRMEFGPRALGARSILADPRRPDMRDRINAMIKQRESFRPFAPAVLEARAQDYFELTHPSPFMLETCRVRAPIPLPAVTHVDGSARVQTVDAGTNRRFAALLAEFDRKAGCPIVLNTSFNMRGEPIVCSAVDAIACFVRSNIDVLVLEDFVLDRTEVPVGWEFFLRGGASSGPRASSDYTVYTFL
jgi:carbamoyltransferase